MGNSLLLLWFDQLDKMLESEAQLCGLLGHNGTVGQAREFLLKNVLSRILPSTVHIGSGRVIDSFGGESKQIDVVVYDPRFPMLSSEGAALYFVEGVLATIEVKSTINSAKLTEALDNCRSVLELRVVGEHQEEMERRVAHYQKEHRLSQQEAVDRFWYMMRPATYVFAYRSELGISRTRDVIGEWWNQDNCARSACMPYLPRMICTGNGVCITNDGFLTLEASPDNSVTGRHVMSCFEQKCRFRWFALHTMNTVCSRLGIRNHAEGCQYRVSGYFPLDKYDTPKSAWFIRR